MAALEYRVISIGTLGAHPLWGEDSRIEVRTGHATTTLVSADSARILIDPSLPPAAMLARLGERSPVRANEITHVFLTSADPLHHRALALFEKAAWLAHETEIEARRAAVDEALGRARQGDDPSLIAALDHERALLDRCRPAPDALARGVDLFPLPGVTPGCCGVILALPGATALVCGDAVATSEHLEQAKVLPDCWDVDQARESFAEAIQIADILIPGRDNVAFNPVRRPLGM